jgi:hypothetical protein
MRYHKGKRPKCHATIRELPAFLHHSMILKMKRRRRAPRFNPSPPPQAKTIAKNTSSHACF